MAKKTPKTVTFNGYNNRPYKVMSPEDMSDGIMAFTFNPKIIPNTKNGLLQLDIYHNELVNVMSCLKYCKIRLYHEISSLGKWHLHGYIKIDDKMRFTLFDLVHLKENGVFEIDTINDEIKWKEYVFKQKELMIDFLKEYKIPYEFNTMDSKLLKKKIDPLMAMAKCVEISVDDITEDD